MTKTTNRKKWKKLTQKAFQQAFRSELSMKRQVVTENPEVMASQLLTEQTIVTESLLIDSSQGIQDSDRNTRNPMKRWWGGDGGTIYRKVSYDKITKTTLNKE